jgi:hypothetical protein
VTDNDLEIIEIRSYDVKGEKLARFVNIDAAAALSPKM